MKDKLWIFQIPVVVLFTFAFWLTETGMRGDLHNPVLRQKFFQSFRSFSGWFTDQKFKVRGPQPARNKIIIVAIDENAITAKGRWPWHRDEIAHLLDRIVELGAKVVGLDMVFSEPDVRTPPHLLEMLAKSGLAQEAKAAETDPVLMEEILLNREKIVLGWMSNLSCQPGFSEGYFPQPECPSSPFRKDAPSGEDAFLSAHEHTSFNLFEYGDNPFQLETKLMTSLEPIINYPDFTIAAKHAGYFDAWPDSDGVIRRTSLLLMINGKPYPTIALAMARAGTGRSIALQLDEQGKVDFLGFAGSTQSLAVSPLGVMEINLRGPAASFPYFSAADLLTPDQKEFRIDAVGRNPASLLNIDQLKAEFKDAYVLIGATALGINDRRSFSFDAGMPGTEGHANILDNILSGDMLIHGSTFGSAAWIFLLMTVGALLLAYCAEKLESIPALALALGALGTFAFIDFHVLFAKNHIDWNTGFFYTEMACVFMTTLAIKYVLEERNKKFIRGAFSKYLSPAIIDSILKDPSKLSVGGVKRDLTILFSDIRGFTTFSEKMDAPRLAKFLNEYLSVMTDLVFEHEGTLDKYIGDAVMAFWGAPLDQPKHAYNACIAAIKMQQALDKVRPHFKSVYDVQVDIGIGINSGAVNVGNMGSERIFEYTVIGDHVNLASRLEGLTKYYGVKIVTTRYTFQHIEEAKAEVPAHRTLDFVKVKGKKTAVELIQIFDRDYPREGLRHFEEGRVLYTQQKWDEAISKFESAAAELKKSISDEDDYPCQMYIERCQDFKKSPPAPDWDGSWEMTSK